MGYSPFCENNKSESYREIYLESLIRSGEIEKALSRIQEWTAEEIAKSSSFMESMSQLSIICQLRMNVPIMDLILSHIRVAELIHRTVALGLLDLAETLVNKYPDNYHQSELIQSLYKHGYVSTAKEKLTSFHKLLLNEKSCSVLNLNFISAEILHDEGRYSEAAEIFESLVISNPDMARARFGAASCYLLDAIDNLTGRITIYNPSEEDRMRIERYLSDITQSLQIITKSGWHTVWSLEQQRNLPDQVVEQSALLH
ncbi:tetratricopeptide repeat protein [Paenibacillus segetis]|uniref:Tetratricopeptide repeat-containing protein n=1 Tax=Paenibacillus segetis TaxID=1325360 RepID=A0ABQ1YHB7_9BACL|nr:tetratricopeptide repeat protein [Paenibacillus segetis]GGH24985.1 hypothetical protein GCM10008013_25000 [Paenibacillus segetis]